MKVGQFTKLLLSFVDKTKWQTHRWYFNIFVFHR